MAAGTLVPAGIYCLKKSNELDRRYWALAMLPLMFGLQQLLEGGVWVALQAGEAAAAHGFASGYLFFSHLVWLIWIPYSSYLTERKRGRKQLFLVMTWLGGLVGAYMYVPLLIDSSWITTAIVNQAIDYDLVFVFDAYISQRAMSGLYGAVILLPLLLSSDRYHQWLGSMMFISAVATWVIFDWVFISVWCYFAAIISLYIFFVIAHRVQVARIPKTIA
jgi:hypothetical protein